MRIAVIGAGSIGQRHLRNLLALGHDVVAVLDPDGARRDEVRRIAPAGCLVTADERAIFDGDAVAAVVCSPTHRHLDQALAAVRRGWHVFVEKPLSHTLEGIEALVEEARRGRRAVLVGCNLRAPIAVTTSRTGGQRRTTAVGTVRGRRPAAGSSWTRSTNSTT